MARWGPERRRVWGWMLYDVAQQPYATLGLTFVFGPFFAQVAAARFAAEGAAAPEAAAQALWGWSQTLAGLAIALLGPLVGLVADRTGRVLPLVVLFSALYVPCAWALWWLRPDGSNLYAILLLFWVGFAAGEAALNLNNAQLPDVAAPGEVGRVSGSGAAAGYWGGVVALALVLLLLVDNPAGTTLLGNPPAFGLDGASFEGTRAVGPFIALWMVVFLVPHALWTRDASRPPPRPRLRLLPGLVASLRDVGRRPSLLSFLLSSMLARDGLGALYAFGGVYATLVLGWGVITVGLFGIVAAVAAAVLTWAGGLADRRWGPRPVVAVSCVVLLLVCTVVIGVSRTSFFGWAFPTATAIPDILFFGCGALIGGAGGALYAASRTLMARHAEPGRAGEAFGLFALSGKATAFLAPALVAGATAATGSVQWGFAPVIVLFMGALLLLGRVRPEGDRVVGPPLA